MSSNDSVDEATRTLVGARPIKKVERETEDLEDVPRKTEIDSAPTDGTHRPTEPAAQGRAVQTHSGEPFSPEPPRSIDATGLPAAFVEELCLKHLFQATELRGGEISRRTCLPPVVIEEVTERLRVARLVEIKGARGVGLGRTQTVFSLTKAGQKHCELALEHDRYVGPAPVSLEAYADAVTAQTIRGNRVSREALRPHFADLVLDDGVFEALGPALNGGRSLFVHGPSGNGKTAVCERLVGCFGGHVLVPRAVMAGDSVIRVFDESIHREVPLPDEGPLYDERWVRCRRPLVVTGGDLVLEDLDLRYSEDVRYYEAPVQVKANGGVLLIDDFGRQKVSPGALLNRWIVPLENEYDFLVTHTGQKLRVPFDVFVIFSTNLDPAMLVDAAFLRRVRTKVEMSRPDTRRFREIFAAECQRQDVPWDGEAVDDLVKRHYLDAKRPFNACEPRDLLLQVRGLCAYHGVSPRLTRDTLDRAAESYFVRF
jgi:hypothetical protein